MPEVQRIKLDWSNGDPRVARAVERAMTRMGDDGETTRPRTVTYEPGGPGKYALLLTGIGPREFNDGTVVAGTSRLVVGVREPGGPWQIGVAGYGELPGTYFDVAGGQRWPMVLVPLNGAPLEGFLGHISRAGREDDGGMLVTRSSTEGIDEKGSPTVLNNLHGVRLGDLSGESDIVIVNRPK